MMKRMMTVVLCVLLAAGVFAACSADGGASAENIEVMPTLLDTTEYTLYQNIFYNEMGADYEGTQVTKKGTFTTLYDAYNDTARYYVWGYNDQTKCCDWQWEIKFDDVSSLPNNGSLVEVSGIFEASEEALDGYWITNPTVTVETEYTPIKCDIDMATMSATLERVEIANIRMLPEYFEGKTAALYGRMKSDSGVEHPYYDETWEMAVSFDGEVPAFGTMVLVVGTITQGAITDATVTQTTMYS